MARNGSAPTKPQELTTAQVARKLKARGLKATPDEIIQLTKMINDDLAREAQGKALEGFMAEFWAPVRKEKRKR